LRRKAITNPVISVMAGGLNSPYTNSLLETYEYTALWNLFKSMPGNASVYGAAAASDEPQFALNAWLTKDDYFEVIDSAVRSGLKPTVVSPASPYSLVFLASDQRVLADDPIPAVFESPFEQDHHAAASNQDTAFLHVVRTLPPDTRSVEVRKGNRVLAHIDRPTQGPKVNVHPVQASALAPDGALTGALALSWDASHPEGAKLTYTVSYSPDAGATWTPIGTALVRTTLQWDSRGTGGSHKALLRVEASDGFNTASAISGAPFQVAAKPPLV